MTGLQAYRTTVKGFDEVCIVFAETAGIAKSMTLRQVRSAGWTHTGFVDVAARRSRKHDQLINQNKRLLSIESANAALREVQP